MDITLSQNGPGRVGNDKDVALAMARAAQAYAENAPTWNFVQGNLIAENRFLRRAVLVTNALGAALILTLIVVMYAVARTGGTRVWAVPVNHDGAVVARAVAVPMTTSPTSGEILSRLKQVTESLFSASIQPSVNRARDDFSVEFLTRQAQQYIVAYRAADKNTRDPAAIARQGYFVDVNVSRIIPEGGNAYEVDWTERTSDLSGREVSKRQMSAIYSVAVEPRAATPDNPYGVFITSIHFATSFGGGS